MNKIMLFLQLSPLYPLKGRIAVNVSQTKLATNPPLRGSGGEIKPYNLTSLK